MSQYISLGGVQFVSNKLSDHQPKGVKVMTLEHICTLMKKKGNVTYLDKRHLEEN